jgi:hypothetical protein
LDTPEEEIAELLADSEDSHNMWEYELEFNPDDNKWYVSYAYDTYMYEPASAQTFDF